MDKAKSAVVCVAGRRNQKNVTRFPLGTARSGKQQFVNRMGRDERQRRLDAVPGGKNKQCGAAFSINEWRAYRAKLAEDLFLLIMGFGWPVERFSFAVCLL